jgi:ABC-2 type transport system ATP-binding protein
VTAPAIELLKLGKQYGATVALREVSLVVARGEVFGYVGPNGAGKTTTIKVLTGLLRPSSGSALVAGFSVQDQPLEAKARIGYVPESGALFDKFTPWEYLLLVGRLYRVPEERLHERRERWLGYFGLLEQRDAPLSTLSKGTKQKVCWASALLHDPEVLVLDEPLNGLDVEAVARAKDLMAGLASEGRTVFYSSHLIDIVARVCTRVAVLHRGALVAQGTVDEVAASLRAPSLEQGLLALAAER